MDLIKFFIKDEVPAVGLSKFKEKQTEETYTYYKQPRLYMKNQVFKPNYQNNIFIY